MLVPILFAMGASHVLLWSLWVATAGQQDPLGHGCRAP